MGLYPDTCPFKATANFPGYGGHVSSHPGHRNRLRSLAILVSVGCATVLAVIAVNSALPQSVREDVLGAPVVVPAEYAEVIKEAWSRCQSIPLDVFAAQLHAESGWDPTATSSAGAQGIAQFMPATWEQYGIDADGDGSADVWNPVDAIHSAAELNCVNRKLIAPVAGRKLPNTLAAYNAGHGAVREYKGVPPFPETENYVAKILKNAKTLQWPS